MNLHFRPPARQRGMVMISALLLLLVATILAATMFRSFGTQEKIAGNLREKERAMHAAVTAQQYAEYLLQSAAPPAPVVCNSQTDSTGVAVVCSNPIPASSIANPDSWPGYFKYVPPDPASSTGQNMQVTTTPGVGTYYSKPVFYIADLGPAPASMGVNGEIYQIDASASGGTPDTVAVVESTYLVVAGSTGGGGGGGDTAGGQ